MSRVMRKVLTSAVAKGNEPIDIRRDITMGSKEDSETEEDEDFKTAIKL